MPIALDANLSFLKRPDGSCELSMKKTKVLCGVNGPGDIQTSKKKYDRMNVLFSLSRLTTNKNICADISSNGNSASKNSPAPCSSTIFIESVINLAVDVNAFPRTGLHVCAQELKVDGAVDSTLVNGLCLALLDAGIRLKHIFAAVTIARLGDGDGVFLVEPNRLELNDAMAQFLFVFKPSLTESGGCTLIANDSFGHFSTNDFRQALERARKECLSIFDFYRRKVFEKFAPCVLK